MPSANLPLWKGVSISKDSTTQHYISQGLRQLEESSQTLLHILENISSSPRESGDTDTNNNTITTVQAYLQESEKLKEKADDSIKSSSLVKDEMRSYLEQCATWNEEIDKEIKSLDAELAALIRNKGPQEVQMEMDSCKKVIPGFGMLSAIRCAAQNTVSKFKRKLEQLNFFHFPIEMDPNMQNGIRYFDLFTLTYS